MYIYSLNELVHDQVNGLVFETSQDLYEQWVVKIQQI